MAKQDQKQLQKRAVKPFVPSWSGGIKLVGLDPQGFDPTNVPTFSATWDVSAGTLTFDVTSGNAADFGLVKFFLDDCNGTNTQVVYAGAPIAINYNYSATSYVRDMPIKVGVVYKAKAGLTMGEPRVLDYYAPIARGAFAADFAVDTKDRLHSDDRGMAIYDLAAAYDATGGSEHVDVTANVPAGAGLTFEVFQNNVSIGTGTVGDDGAVAFANAGILAAGDYTYKLVITQGVGKNSFNTVSITV
jgi:hypothetical protein